MKGIFTGEKRHKIEKLKSVTMLFKGIIINTKSEEGN